MGKNNSIFLGVNISMTTKISIWHLVHTPLGYLEGMIEDKNVTIDVWKGVGSVVAVGVNESIGNDLRWSVWHDLREKDKQTT